VKKKPIDEVLEVMAKLRSPKGCPWDQEQDHMSLRFHAVEEVYELMDAIEAGDDHEMLEELGDLLLQVVFHCQLARERKAFDFDGVCKRLVEKLVRRHPHVFGESNAKTVDAVWAQWEQIKKEEKHGTKHHRASALDGIPKHLPSLLRAEKLVKKARKAKLLNGKLRMRIQKKRIAEALFDLAAIAHMQGWSAEELLRGEVRRCEKALRKKERHA
jgi:MazG family protein